MALPDFTTQDAATYKASIDETSAIHDQAAGAFYAHEAATPDMTVVVNAGNIQNGTSLVTVAAQTTSTFTAPTTDPRIDRIVVDNVTGAISVISGTEAANPTAPALTANKIAVAQVLLQTSSTVITNSMVTDERAINQPIKTLASPIITPTLIDDTTDLDSLPANGYYTWDNTASLPLNAPTGSTRNILQEINDTGQDMQLVWGGSSTNAILASRRKDGGTWQAWEYFANTSTLGALATKDNIATGDLDTGAVTTLKIASLSVTEGKVAVGAISDSKLAKATTTASVIVSAASSYILPFGTYLIAGYAGIETQIWVPSSWRMMYPEGTGGMCISDGANTRLTNSTGADITVYYRDLD